VNCDQLAALIRSSEDGAGNVTDEVLPDGTCVIHSNRYPGGTPYPVGTTLVPSTTDDGTVIYIVRDPSGHEVETFYMYNDEVIAIVYYYVIPGDASSGTPDRVVPKSLVTRLFHFDTGKWDILPSEKPIEKVVASAIEDVAKAEGSSLQVIEVQGHTDDVGGKEMNLVLSKKRADEVRLVLLKELNSSSFTPQIPWEQFLVARGLGSSQTISGPSGHRNGYAVFTARDRTLNRRVEIHFNY
jgi:outer membrane protein OmpA-like peptidoglycan-associated protein